MTANADRARRDTTAPARSASGFARTLGVEFLERGPEHAVLGLQIGERHLNLSGVIHGGILATLLDIAGSAAGSYCPHPDRVRRVMTLSMTTTFTAQGGPGYIRAVARRRAGGRRIFYATVEIVDAEDRLLAIGEGTFRLRSGSEDPEGVAMDGQST